MYLSKLLLNLKSRQARKDLGNPYELHRTILRAFATPMQADERVLFRVEYEGIPLGSTIILVQSLYHPDWEKISEQYNQYFLNSPTVKNISEFHIAANEVMRFRLRANPTKRENLPGKSGNRIGLYKDAERTSWLERKGEDNGFNLMKESLLIRPYPQRNFLISDGKNNHKATFVIVDFDGLLKVESPEKLINAIKKGLGPAKGLGCGLLSLARTK
jgi:CRISPR system Cascade subunit CasE